MALKQFEPILFVASPFNMNEHLRYCLLEDWLPEFLVTHGRFYAIDFP